MKIVEFAKHIDPDEVTPHESTLFCILVFEFFFLIQLLPSFFCLPNFANIHRFRLVVNTILACIDL